MHSCVYVYLSWNPARTSGSRSRSECNHHSAASVQTTQSPVSDIRGEWEATLAGLNWSHSQTHAEGNIGTWYLTWIRDLMLANCVSMAPPFGKFWLILFISWVKQLYARHSELRTQAQEEHWVMSPGNSLINVTARSLLQDQADRQDHQNRASEPRHQTVPPYKVSTFVDCIF